MLIIADFTIVNMLITVDKTLYLHVNQHISIVNNC